MPCSVYVATSLDGFIADRDGGLGWLFELPKPEGSGDFGFGDFIAGIDAVLMGRRTFEFMRDVEPWYYPKPVFVWSRDPQVVPAKLADRAERIDGSPAQMVQALAARGMTRLYVDGGATVQAFMADDLIDELTITLIPTVLGGGVPLFGPLEQRLRFELVSTEVLVGQAVKLRWRRRR